MTGLVHESPVSSLVLPVVMRPILSGLERQDQGASQTLRAAFSKVLSHNKRLLPHNAFFFLTQVEYAHPGFTYDLVMRLVTLASIFIADEVPHYL